MTTGGVITWPMDLGVLMPQRPEELQKAHDRRDLAEFVDANLSRFFMREAERVRISDPLVAGEYDQMAYTASSAVGALQVERNVAPEYRGGEDFGESRRAYADLEQIRARMDRTGQTPLAQAFAYAQLDREFIPQDPARWARMEETQPELVRNVRALARLAK